MGAVGVLGGPLGAGSFLADATGPSHVVKCEMLPGCSTAPGTLKQFMGRSNKLLPVNGPDIQCPS